jgi:hypothetical protein
MPDIHDFVVEGRTSFPIDMLRYDRCWPRTELDAGEVERSFRRVEGVRGVRVVSLSGLRAPTDGRWESFGWKVS